MNNPYLKSLKPAWKRPRRVYVSKERIRNFALKLAREKFETPAWREPVFPANFVDFMKFILIANAINFCFTDPLSRRKFQINYAGTLWRGSMAMAACLKRALDDGLPLFSADYLENLNPEAVEHIFRSRGANEWPIPLLNERLLALNEIGRIINKHFGGSFLAIYEISDFRAFNNGRGLVELLIKYFPSFNDVSVLENGKTLQFQKRAQLLTMVYQGRAKDTFRERQFPLIKDADALGPIADYAVPAALEDTGILVYSQDLKRKITAGEMIPKNSREEIEIRAQTVYAMLKLMKEINKIRSDGETGLRTINMMELDYMIWTLGRDVKTPHHLTITTAY